MNLYKHSTVVYFNTPLVHITCVLTPLFIIYHLVLIICRFHHFPSRCPILPHDLIIKTLRYYTVLYVIESVRTSAEIDFGLNSNIFHMKVGFGRKAKNLDFWIFQKKSGIFSTLDIDLSTQSDCSQTLKISSAGKS